MVIQFRDRKNDLAAIDKAMSSKDFQLIVVYGRRRVGKTELVLHGTSGCKRLYYLATEKNNIDRFHMACQLFDKGASRVARDWEALFGFLKGRADAVILDEFQNMVKEDPSILGILQSIVDIELKGSGMKLFLLGSSVSMIKSSVLAYKSPLYGRRTASINVKPMKLADLREFFPKESLEGLINIYGFADGIPLYLNKITGGFWSWLGKELASGTFLKDEADFIVKYEFDDAGTYKLILEALSKGMAKVNEIKDSIGAKRTDISPYLSNLIEVGLIKREVPITETPRSRSGRYSLSDNFLRFWFRFIYPNLGMIEEGAFKASSIKAAYPAYIGRVFEDVCRQALLKSSPIGLDKLGRWWDKGIEIDLVGLNTEAKEILFSECKWKEGVNPKKLLSELSEKAGHVTWNQGKRKERFVLFAKSFKGRVSEWEGRPVQCLGLKEIAKALEV